MTPLYCPRRAYNTQLVYCTPTDQYAVQRLMRARSDPFVIRTYSRPHLRHRINDCIEQRLRNITRMGLHHRTCTKRPHRNLVLTPISATPQTVRSNAVIYYASDAEALQYLDSVSSPDHENNCLDDDAMDPALKDLVPDFRSRFTVLPLAHSPFVYVSTDFRTRHNLLLRWNGAEHNQTGCTLSECLPVGNFDIKCRVLSSTFCTRLTYFQLLP